MSGQPRYPDVEVQLSGEDGHPIMIVGRVKKALVRAGVPADEVARFRDEALSGDYDQVLQTAMKWVDVQ